MKRLRHLSHTAQQGGHIQTDEQQVTPIFDLIAQAVHKWNILGLTKFDDLAYEDTVVWLLQHLPEAHDVSSVESLVFQAFAEQQESTDFSPDQSLIIKFLADDLWSAWTEYLQRSEKPTFSQAHSRARMRRFYYPR